MPSWDKKTPTNTIQPEPKDYEDLLIAYEKLQKENELNKKKTEDLSSSVKKLEKLVETSAQAYKEQIQTNVEGDQKRARILQNLVKKNEEWKKQTVVDLSEYSPEKIEKTLQTAVNKQLPKYKAALDQALNTANQTADREKRAFWLNNLATFGIFAVTLGLIVGSIKFFMGF